MKYMHMALDEETKQGFQRNLDNLPIHQRYRRKRTIQCDFCSGDDPQYAFAASRTTDGRLVKCWRWLACQTCRDIIESGDFKALERRSASRIGYDSDTGRAVIKMALMAFHADAIEVNH